VSEHHKEIASSLNAKSEAWSGRFNEPVAELVKRYTASVSFDQRLAEFDIQGSIAHAQMLAAQQIISADDLVAIEKGLAEIKQEIQVGKFEWLLDLEDVHLNIEKALTDKIGDAGKRLHTGRSRNDQVATDIRLYLRAVCDDAMVAIQKLQMSLLDLAEQHADTIMPGFTHLQVAQPVTFGHHLLAYYEMLKRDASRFADCQKTHQSAAFGRCGIGGH
jgi:argininosuccinate lyase